MCKVFGPHLGNYCLFTYQQFHFFCFLDPEADSNSAKISCIWSLPWKSSGFVGWWTREGIGATTVGTLRTDNKESVLEVRTLKEILQRF